MVTPYYADESVTVYAGDCLDVLPALPDGSVDAVVCDPPYGLEFMGREWDSFRPGGKRPVLGAADGSPMRRSTGTPAWGATGNPGCRRCGGQRYGNNPSRQCECELPDFGNPMAGQMQTYQAWCQLWAVECLRALKPGGHLLAFGGTRTYHRLTCAVEDAGFEVRDCITWIYGSGFSKSWNFNTQFDGRWCDCPGGNTVPYSHAHDSGVLGMRRDVQPSSLSRREGEDTGLFPAVQREAARTGMGEARSQGAGGVVAGERGGAAGTDERRVESGLGGRVVHRARQGLSDGAQPESPEGEGERLRGRTFAGDGADDRPAGDGERGSASHQPRPGGQSAGESAAVPGSYGALDDGALRGRSTCPRCGGLRPEFRGFGTGLKPASEPVVVARKPLAGTVAANVVAHGVGALNIDACRVGTGEGKTPAPTVRRDSRPWFIHSPDPANLGGNDAVGRWPSNVVLSHPPRYDADGLVAGDGCAGGCVDGCPVAELDRQSGVLHSQDPATRFSANARGGQIFGDSRVMSACYGDSGGASRFFSTFRYEAKADSFERPRDGGVAHPTVKPVDLMRWLVRLVTPPGGLVLDPFLGSGTTAEACVVEGFRCVGVEREAAYLPLIVARLSKPLQLTLDAEVGP